MKRLAIVSTHPIQYNAPFFRKISDRNNIELKVFYTWSQAANEIYDNEFGQKLQWDVPLLDGYPYCFVKNVSKRPSSKHFYGIDNPTLKSEINSFAPDYLLVYGWKFLSHLALLRNRTRPYFLLFRGDSHLLDEGSGLNSIARRAILRWVYKRVDMALYCGLANRKYFVQHGFDAKRLKFVPHCVNNEFFEENQEQRLLIAKSKRDEYGIGEDLTLVMFVGKFVAKKNPQLLLDAYASLPKRLRNKLAIAFVGSGPLEEQLRNVAKSIIGGKVIFLPFQNQTQLPGIYRMADVLALPSKGPGETWGLVVNEAMACGIPALVSDKVGCAADLITSQTGWKFESGNTRSLIAVLENIATSHRSTLRDKGNEARKMIQTFSIETAVQKLEEAIAKLHVN